MLKLSEQAKRLTSTFLTYRNTVDIYTEDEEKDKEFYRVLFKRLLRNDIVINDITPLGSKESVKRRCLEEPNNGRKKIFIIDGDVSIIHGKDIPKIPNLYVLEAYCIENFLLDKDSIVDYIYLNCGTKTKDLIAQEINFDTWLLEYSNSFIELFIHFALANYFDIKFTLYNANKYHMKTKTEYLFVPELVTTDILELKKDILKIITENEYSSKYRELKEQWPADPLNLFTIVSGKDYLIPMLLIKTQFFRKSKSLPTLEEVKIALVQYSNLNRLLTLKTIIEAL